MYMLRVCPRRIRTHNAITQAHMYALYIYDAQNIGIFAFDFIGNLSFAARIYVFNEDTRQYWFDIKACAMRSHVV